ncbi:MAG: Hsp20/alpha crystallin family protein [Chloroflexota bacterium]
MAIVRWDPFRELNYLSRTMDRLFDDRFWRPLRAADMGQDTLVGVPVDVYEEADRYVVEASLPGLKSEDLDVSVQGGTVTIAGELPEVAQEGRSYLLRERLGGRFTRTITLPVEIDADKVEARFADGVLHLSLAKAAQFQPKKIAIQAGS